MYLLVFVFHNDCCVKHLLVFGESGRRRQVERLNFFNQLWILLCHDSRSSFLMFFKSFFFKSKVFLEKTPTWSRQFRRGRMVIVKGSSASLKNNSKLKSWGSTTREESSKLQCQCSARWDVGGWLKVGWGWAASFHLSNLVFPGHMSEVCLGHFAQLILIYVPGS